MLLFPSSKIDTNVFEQWPQYEGHCLTFGKFNIRVNAVCPGTIKGDRMKRVIRDKAKFTKVSTKVIEKDFVSMSSMKQWILEEDIGKMCSFLISDDSNKVSGQVISVDGHTERNN